MKAIESMWFSTIDGSVGIVLAVNAAKKNVILVKRTVAFNSETNDTKATLEWGAKLSFEQVERMYNHLKLLTTK